MPQQPLKPIEDSLDAGPLQRKFEDPHSKLVQMVKNLDDRKDDVYEKGDDYLPLPPHPYPFKQEPFVNNPLVGQMLHRIIRKVPAAANSVGRVTVGPDINTVDRMMPPDESQMTMSQKLNKIMGNQITPLDYDKSNLYGTTNTNTGDISINPALTKGAGRDLLLQTLSHELTHAAGFGDQTAYPIGDEMRRKNPGVK
jgi:hypothetical protein